MIRSSIFAWMFGTIVTALGAALPNSPGRVAVIGTPETADLAALIVTELSSNPTITLVERDDLEKVGDESKLQRLAGAMLWRSESW